MWSIHANQWSEYTSVELPHNSHHSAQPYVLIKSSHKAIVLILYINSRSLLYTMIHLLVPLLVSSSHYSTVIVLVLATSAASSSHHTTSTSTSTRTSGTTITVLPTTYVRPSQLILVVLGSNVSSWYYHCPRLSVAGAWWSWYDNVHIRSTNTNTLMLILW